MPWKIWLERTLYLRMYYRCFRLRCVPVVAPGSLTPSQRSPIYPGFCITVHYIVLEYEIRKRAPRAKPPPILLIISFCSNFHMLFGPSWPKWSKLRFPRRDLLHFTPADRRSSVVPLSGDFTEELFPWRSNFPIALISCNCNVLMAVRTGHFQFKKSSLMIN